MKPKVRFVCHGCGYSSPKWMGRCSGCGEWNTLTEERDTPAAEGSASAVRDEFRGMRGAQAGLPRTDAPWVPLDPGSDGDKGGDRAAQAVGPQRRHSTGIGELDRVLGGGLVPDSFTLLGGDPGIGKSTLLLQMARGVSETSAKAGRALTVLYVSGEESVDQIRGRAHRLGGVAGLKIFLSAENQLERAFASVKELAPDVLIMDSLQTFSTGTLESAPGSVSQVREVAARLMTLAKSAGMAVWIVGHVTKDGAIAGPKVVEHIVDTVLYFEGEGTQSHRLLRAVKNRFGGAHELGVFEMTSTGLAEVSNPSALFLNERDSAAPGVAVGSSLEGSRPLLVELQALVSSSPLAMPRRTSVGMDSARVALIAAILERHMEVSLAQQDLFFNVAGGLKLSEPACDLAAAAAIWSSATGRAFPADWLFIGEIGLTGEVRRVAQPDLRIEEATKLGFKRIIIPARGSEKLKASRGVELAKVSKIGDLPGLLG